MKKKCFICEPTIFLKYVNLNVFFILFFMRQAPVVEKLNSAFYHYPVDNT